MSIFNKLKNEFTGRFYQTEPLSSIPHHINRLIEVAAVIRVHYINDPFWKLEIQKGSFTFRYHYHKKCGLCKKDQHKVIKIFVDVGQKLVSMEGAYNLFRKDYDPIAVAIELGYEDPFVRKSIRKLLREDFKDYYLDPEANHRKYKLNPSEHYYDIAFLKEGRCPEDLIDSRVRSVFEEISAEVEEKIAKTTEDIFKK